MSNRSADPRDATMDEFFAATSAATDYGAGEQTLKAIHRKVAVSSIPASALRGQRTPGIIRTARDFLSTAPLAQFGVASEKAFASRLDAITNDLLAEFPKKARRWGVARKAVNLFLRDAYYNQFLATEYHLSRAAIFFELPLDSYTAAAVYNNDDEWDLPKWRGLGPLTPLENAAYQEAAIDMATEYGCERVHLDAYIWGMPR